MTTALSPRLLTKRDDLSRLPASELMPITGAGMADVVRHGLPRKGLSGEVNTWRRRNLGYLWHGARRALAARALGIPTIYGALWLKLIRADGEEIDYGLASLRVVTTAGCNEVVANLIGTKNNIALFKYHGIGTGATAAASSDTALQTELTTQYSPASTRATGTQGTGGSNNIYSTTGTNTVSASVSITEHGLFTQAATGGGTLIDRSTFAVVSLNSGDSIQTPFNFTMVAGG